MKRSEAVKQFITKLNQHYGYDASPDESDVRLYIEIFEDIGMKPPDYLMILSQFPGDFDTYLVTGEWEAE